LKESSIVRKAKRIDEILADMYGAKKQTKLRDPTEELILTVLSQNTNDINRDRAFTSLRKRFPDWNDVAEANPSAIARTIKVGGLANIKSKRIIKILRQIGERSADYSIGFLERMSDRDAWDYLMEFDGVGPKTASCVLLFSLGRRAMPVDTHVHRVSVRLGLIPDGYTAENAHEWYRELALPVDIYQFHINMIQHGRTICRPQKPKCEKCPLRKHCMYFKGLRG
jgi:endonuclease-3